MSSTLVMADKHSKDTADLDDIKLYDIVKVEHCLDQAYDTIPGHARKLEFKIEGDDPIYEFDIQSTNDGQIYIFNELKKAPSEVLDFVSFPGFCESPNNLCW